MAITVGIHKDQFYIEKEYSASNTMPLDENGEKVFADNDFEVVESKRINIDYAEEAKDYLWRYYIKGNKYVSVK